MTDIRFEWDPRKEQANKRKHKIDFDEAKSVFFDVDAIQFFDDEHSDEEDRFILLGMSYSSRVLVVVHAEYHHGKSDIIRIISARKATRNERTHYEE